MPVRMQGPAQAHEVACQPCVVAGTVSTALGLQMPHLAVDAGRADLVWASALLLWQGYLVLWSFWTWPFSP